MDGLTCRGKQAAANVSIPTMRKINPYLPREIRQRYHHQDLPRGPRNRSAHRDNVQSHGDKFFCFKISELGAAPITKEKLVYHFKQPDSSDSWELPENFSGAIHSSLISRDFTSVIRIEFYHLSCWDRTFPAKEMFSLTEPT